MTLIKFTGVTAVKWGATNLSKVYAGDVQVWPHPGPTPVNINLEDGYAYANNQTNLPGGPRPLFPVYEIPLGSNINFKGSTSMKVGGTAILEGSQYLLVDDAGAQLGTLSQSQTRYDGTWTFPTTGIAEGDITTIKGYFNDPTLLQTTWGVIKWISAAGTFRKLPTKPTVYQDITINITSEVIPNFPGTGLIYRAINQGNPVMLNQVTGYQDGTYRLVYQPPLRSDHTLTWSLDVAIEGRWWTSGMRPRDSVNAVWDTTLPAWGGQITRHAFDDDPAYRGQWRSVRSAGFIFNDDNWRMATITHRGSTIPEYHFNNSDAFAAYGIARPAGLLMQDLPQFLLNTD